MVGVILLAVIGLCAGGIVWIRRRRWHVYATPVSLQAMPRQTSALHTFAHGNACLVEGKFADAVAAFHQVREIEPKHPHVAGRLVEVERRQRAASATPLANATV